MKRNYEYSERATLAELRIGLRRTRKEKKIYVAAHIIRMIRKRFPHLNVRLSANEKKNLLLKLNRARYGKVPLAPWLPRGYQIARLLLLVQIHIKKSKKPTARDTALARHARTYYRRSKDPFARQQLRSLIETCRLIGLRL